jgi:hypothetical protein
MVAAIGLKIVGYDKQELISLFKYTLASPLKLLEFTRNSLRSAKDIFNKGVMLQKL